MALTTRQKVLIANGFGSVIKEVIATKRPKNNEGAFVEALIEILERIHDLQPTPAAQTEFFENVEEMLAENRVSASARERAELQRQDALKVAEEAEAQSDLDNVRARRGGRP